MKNTKFIPFSEFEHYIHFHLWKDSLDNNEDKLTDQNAQLLI